MALEPFRRKVGAAGAVPLVPVRTVNIPDVGGEIVRAGQQIFASGAEGRRQKAIEQAQSDVAQIEVRRPDGSLITERPEADGGATYRNAYQKLLAEKYITEFTFDVQTQFDKFAVEHFNNPEELYKVGLSYIDGALSNVPSEFQDQARQIALREGQERFRASMNRFGREQQASEIRAVLNRVETLTQEYINLTQDPSATEDRFAAVKSLITSNVEALSEYGRVESEVNSILEDIDQKIGTADEYTISVKNTPDFMAYVTKSESISDLTILQQRLDGVNTPGEISGAVSGGTQRTEATPQYAEEKLKSLFPNVTITSGPRGPDHPLSQANPSSYHNTVNGGRAFDIAPIDGVSFNEYVSRLRSAGFNIVEAIDESTPEAMEKYGSTGPNWHIAYGPTLTENVTTQNAMAIELSFEKLHQLFPSRATRESLQQAIRQRISALKGMEAEARAVAREQRREQQFQEAIGEIVDSQTDGNYNYSTQQRKILDQSFASLLNDQGNLNTEQGRAAAIGFVQSQVYVPKALEGWFTSSLRNPDLFQEALNLFNNVKNTTTQTGSTIGDVLIDQLRPRDVALLNTALELSEGGVPDEIIKKRIDGLVRGETYSATEAVEETNRINGSGSYQTQKAEVLKEALGVEGIPPKSVSLSFDEAYAANLALNEGNVEKALEATQNQLSSLMIQSNIFHNGIGYKRVIERIGGTPTEFNKILRDHLVTLTTPDGLPLLKTYMTAEGTQVGHRIGGPNSSIKIEPIDGNVQELGRYKVYIMNPANLNVLLGTIEIDLGKDLAPQIQGYRRRQESERAAADQAGIEEARRLREQGEAETQEIMRRSRTVTGPKL